MTGLLAKGFSSRLAANLSASAIVRSLIGHFPGSYSMFVMPLLRAGESLRYKGLAVFPLFGSETRVPTYLLSEQALAGGQAVVEEASEGGSVPNLIVTVLGDKPVLFLEGEELRGAKQNRVLNTSVLVAASTKTPIPVSCVEQGRWRYTSRHFGSAGTHASSKMRRVLKETVSKSSREGRGHSSDQGAVWTEVARQMSSLGSTSATSAMSDTYDTYQSQVSEYQSHLPYVPGAIGMAVAVGNAIVTLDLFEAPEVCQMAWPRLLSGTILDAVEERCTAGNPNLADALAAFEADWQQVPAVGIGEEFRADRVNGKWHGSVLANEGRIIHGSLVLAI